MSDRKPLSDKKLRRLLKTEKKKQDKKQKKDKVPDLPEEVPVGRTKVKTFFDKLPQEWQAHPSHLKGREVGLWYSERRKLTKQVKVVGSQITEPQTSSRSQGSPKEEKKLSKKERKALKKAERAAKITRKRKEKENVDECFKIAFDSERERLIQEYLNSVKDQPPSFLIPLSEYHKKLRINHPFDNSDQSETFDGVDIPENEDMEITLEMTKRIYETFPCDLSSDLTVNQIETYLNDGADAECYREIVVEQETCNQYSEHISYERALNDSSDLNLDDSFMDSVDKYKHLEETPFKQNFLALLSSNIQENLLNAAKKNNLNRMVRLDKELYHAFRAKERNYKYKHMLNERRKLPAFQMQNDILSLIHQNQVVLISGETGCGKTTQVAQFILDEAILNNNGSLCNIICTQPRRISAISVSQRVSDERAEVLGHDCIGYQIRLERKIGRPRGAILYCTTGILLQYMQGDSALSKYSHIIIDEIHERDTLCDFVLTILKDIAVQRKDLKIILMSATLNAERFSMYFENCPQIKIPGYTYLVEELYLEDVLYCTKFQFSSKKNMKIEDPNFKKHVIPYAQSLKGKYPDFVVDGLRNPDSEKINPDLIISLIKYICESQGPGAILIFVPGWEDINAIMRKINEQSDFFNPSFFLVIPLHSMLPTASQQSVFDSPPRGQRKIVVATNIAETSITINDVVYVIDCGKIKIKNYDVINNISTLKPEFVSLANAHQRRGRAGRVQSGVCYHLFSRGREAVLVDYPLPEMLRTRLEEVVLSIKLLQLGKAVPFLEKVMDPPNPRAVSLAIQLLVQLNALDENENLTPLGFHLAKLPLDPQIGKMLLMAVTMSCLSPILSIAATLSFKDPFHVPLGEERNVKERKLELDKGHKSDHLIMAEVMDRWEEKQMHGKEKAFCHHNYLNQNTLRQLKEQKLLFAQYLLDMGFLSNTNYRKKNLNMNSDNIALVKAVICSGLYPNVAIIQRQANATQKKNVLLRTSEDGKVTLHPKSVNTVQTTNFESNFLVYHEKLLSRCIFIYDTTMVSILPLLVFCYDFYLTYTKNEAVIELNKDLRFVCSKRTAFYITELKLRLNWLLEYKLSHPGQVLWKDDTSEIGLLKTLTELFTNENDLVMAAKYDSSDDSDEF